MKKLHIALSLILSLCFIFAGCDLDIEDETISISGDLTYYAETENTAPTNETTTTPPTESSTTHPIEPTTTPTTESEHTHSFGDATCTTPRTCDCGATEGKANGHSWTDATCTSPKICSTCGERSGTAIPHDYAKGQCTACGAKDPSYISEKLVWVPTRGGTKYHRNSSCSKMIDPIQVTLSEAINMGYTPCGKCY